MSFFRGPNGPETQGQGQIPDLPTNIRPLVIGAAALGGFIAFMLLLSWFRSIYTDLLWFDNLGFREVFSTIIVTRVWLFVAGAAALAALVSVNIYLTYRYGQGPQMAPMPEETLKVLRPLVLAGVVFVVGVVSLVFGGVSAANWDTVLAFMNSSSFGIDDPQFNQDVSFYVFQMPLYHFVRGWLLGAVIISMLFTLGMYFVHFSLRGAVFTFTPAVRVHVSVLGALLLFIFAAGYYLSIFDLVYSDRGAVVGATYTDVTARVLSLRVLMAIVFVGGVLLLINALAWQRLQLIVGVLGLWIGAAIVIGLLYPSMVQRFQVVPNELEREEPYIIRNIEMTRHAFALNRIEEQDYPLAEVGVLNAPLVEGNQETLDNIRLWDHRPFKDVLNQVQFFRLYYTFLNVDVDRYVLEEDGETQLRQVMLGVRELSPDNLPQESQRWVNRKLQYTHGYGAVVAPVVDFTREGRPKFIVKDIPVEGQLAVTQPEVYYGEQTEDDYVIVNSNEPEVDFPGPEGSPIYTQYQGNGGIPLSGFFRRLAYAWEFRDINILISGEVAPESRIQYHRNIQERITAVAPFLHLDADPYIVIADGRLLWVQDAYLTTDRFPYATPLTGRFGTFNYIRNSVKVVMDAYDGALTFYVFETEDALVQTYAKVFPVLFEDASRMDELHPGLRAHVRYPQDLFEAQAIQYLTYHMTDPKVFFNKEDQWSIPNEFFRDDFQPMEPYYLNMRLPREDEQEFVLLLPFTPVNRDNMVAWLAARSDGEEYGKLVSFDFPKGRQIDGPAQVEKRIDQEPVIKQDFTLLCPPGGAARCIRGNLLVIPLEGDEATGAENTLIYAEPLYLQAGGTPFPELKRVILVDGERVVMRARLEDALEALTGDAPATSTISTASTEALTRITTTGQPSTTETDFETELGRASEALDELQRQLQALQEALDRLETLVEESSR